MDKMEQFIKKILKICHLNLSNKMEKLLIQIFKFGVVGVIATIIDFACLFIFREYFNLPVVIANTLSFSISVVYNYWASVKWVFDVNKEKNSKTNFILFILFSVIGLVLSDLIVYFSTEKIGIYYMISKIIATAIVMVFNFVTRKLFLE